MRSSSALTHPLAVAILLASLVLAVAAAAWAPWAGRGPWLAGWGVLAYAAVVLLVRRRDAPAAPRPVGAPPPSHVPANIDLARLTEEALRGLKNPAALAECQLAEHIPQLLAEAGAVASRTPLERTQQLRQVLEASVERLKPVDDAPSGSDYDTLVYAILHEEYILGRPNTQIMTRYSISESTFHRYRRAGVRAVAGDLARLEELAQSGR